ncbi:hypothetical protein ACFLZ0_00820 [Patescibacteria group bacterium]
MYLKFLKNFILSSIIFVIIFFRGWITGFCSILILLFLSGLISGIFIREKELIPYIKKGLINSLIFSVLLGIELLFLILIKDGIDQCSILYFIMMSSGFFIFNFFGILGGIIPKYFID